MNFNQLIKTLVDYLNLGKQIANTIPGMVLAGGLVILFSNPPDFFRPNGLQTERQKQDNTLGLLRTEGAKLERDKTAAEYTLSDINAVVAGYQSTYDNAAKSFKNNPDATRLKNLRAAQTKLRDPELRRQQLAAKQVLDELQLQLNANKLNAVQREADLKKLDSRIEDSAGFTTGVSNLFNSVILFGLVGFALGTVLDPVNKAIFLRALPELGKRGRVGKAIFGHLTRLKEKPELADLSVSANDVQFYIGKGLITAAEYDALQASEYRLSEMSLGMIIPTLMLGFACISSRMTTASTEFKVAVAVGTIATGITLYYSGLHRYGRFQLHVYSLIEGREDAFEQQKVNAVRDAVIAGQASTIRDLKEALFRRR